MATTAKKKQATPRPQKQTNKAENLTYKSFLDPDDLCNYINENKIKPFSLNVTDRFYIVFYYEKQ